MQRRNRFLMDANWVLLRAELSWAHWKDVSGNLKKLERYFKEKPIWVRAFRIWRLVHQVAAFTYHPELIEAREAWRKKMKGLDEGKVSEVRAAEDTSTALSVGLTLRELRAIYRRVNCKPNWRFMEHKYVIGKQCNQRGVGRA